MITERPVFATTVHHGIEARHGHLRRLAQLDVQLFHPNEPRDGAL
jgi:hypothetical protein